MVNKMNEKTDIKDVTIDYDSNNILNYPKISIEDRKPVTSEILNSFEGKTIKEIYDILTIDNSKDNVKESGISAEYYYTNCQRFEDEY